MSSYEIASWIGVVFLWAAMLLALIEPIRAIACGVVAACWIALTWRKDLWP